MMKEMQDDLRNLDLPKDLGAAATKVKCELVPGRRVFWFFDEDVIFCKEHCDGEDPRERPGYSGIIVPAPNVELRGGGLDWEQCVVVQDTYPVEKCYPEAIYIAFNRLLDAEGLVEIFSK